MKKRIVALFLVSAMCLISVTACGKEEAPEEAAVEETNDAAEEVEETPDVEEETSAAVGGDTLDTTLWTLNYDSSVWSYEEDDLNESENYADAVLSILDGETKKVSVDITAEISDAGNFRNKLFNIGLDEYEYAVNGAYDRVEVGGIECVTTESTYYGSDCIYYVGRDEGAKESVYITVYGDELTNSNVDSLIAGLSFKVNDVGNVDGPWYWDGEPIQNGDLGGTVGSATVSTHQLVMNEPDITHEVFEHRIASIGDKVYILSQDEIKVYDNDGTALTYNTTYPLDDEYSEMQATTNGTLILSGFMRPLIEWSDGTVVNEYSSVDVSYVAMDPTGTWGVSYFTTSECSKVSLNGDGTGSVEDLTFSEISSVRHIDVTNDYILVSGAPEGGDQAVYVYNPDGSYVMTLAREGESYGLGSVTYVAETANGFIALDGNMRQVDFWDKSGSYIGCLEDSDLFGTDYPWFCGGATLGDGTVLALMTEDRDDDSAMEAIVFTISGF